MPYSDLEDRRAYARAYRLAHRDKARVYQRAYRLAHRGKARAYRAAHCDDVRVESRLRRVSHGAYSRKGIRRKKLDTVVQLPLLASD